MSETSKKISPWTIGLSGFWAIVIIVNLFFVYKATQTRALVEDKTYDKSLKYDQKINENKKLKEILGDIQMLPDSTVLSFKAINTVFAENSKQNVAHLKVYRPSDATLDQNLALSWDSSQKIWKASRPQLQKGYYKLSVSLELDHQKFQKEFEYFVN